MCSTPRTRYDHATSIVPVGGCTTNCGLPGCKRSTWLVPSSRSTRAMTSVTPAAFPRWQWSAQPARLHAARASVRSPHRRCSQCADCLRALSHPEIPRPLTVAYPHQAAALSTARRTRRCRLRATRDTPGGRCCSTGWHRSRAPSARRIPPSGPGRPRSRGCPSWVSVRRCGRACKRPECSLREMSHGM